MNFDTKYLIRWGIPGWVMIMILLAYFVAINLDLSLKMVSDSSLSLVATGVLLTVVGVPLGYLCHQVNLFFSWVILRNWRGYFRDEFLLHDRLYEDEHGSVKRERYRYLLSQVHVLGALRTSLLITTGILFVLLIFFRCTWMTFSVFVVSLCLLGIVWVNRKYVQVNLDYFIERHLNKR